MLDQSPAASENLPWRSVARDAPLYIILNVGSGKQDSAQVRAVIESKLNDAGRSFTLYEVKDGSDLSRIADEVVALARSCDGVVVAAGGDGSINAVAQATLGSGCVFGVLPLGTFNYFSRAHGISSQLEEACDILLGERAYEVQVGLVNGHVFLVNASVGLYPQLLEEGEQAKQRYGRSRLIQLGAALRTVLTWYRQLRLDIDSKQGSQTFVTPTLFIGNNRLQLERVGIVEAAHHDERRLTAVAVKTSGGLAMLGLIVRALLGRLGDAEEVTSFDFKRITVRSRFRQRRFKVATDGEIRSLRTPLTFRVAPDPLPLLRPAERREDPG
jgi:diacylglycerol kinase family enzyme